MKLLLLLIIILFTLSESRTIFIGNSLLKRNCVPCIYRKVCRVSSSGSCGTSYSLKGGSTLTFHLNRRRTKRLLKRYPKAAVVLQEQSKLIQQPGYVETSLATFTRKQRNVYLVGTWAHSRDYFNVQFPLNHKFDYLAQKYYIPLLPVGKYWLYINLFSPKLGRRLTTDGIHPSIEGSYLAACIIFRFVHNQAVYLGRRPRSINKADFQLLQFYCNAT